MTGRVGIVGREAENLESSVSSRVRILIIEARYYDDVSDALLEGAVQELKRHGISYDVVTVPGALEIPLALACAVDDDFISANQEGGKYEGAVALGCVIRGETAHFDIVAQNANHFLMAIAVKDKVPLGNAILTVENKEQAMARATGGTESKGAQAVRACLTLVTLQHLRATGAEE